MPSFFKLLPAAGLLVCSCAAGLDRSSLNEKFTKQQERWKSELDSIQNAAYLVRFNAVGPKGKVSGSLEVYWLAGDTIILFSPGLFGKGSLRGRWILGESLLVYFPREKSYYKGNWEDFLLGINSGASGADSLIFSILSREAFLAGDHEIHISNERYNERYNWWAAIQNLGSWQRSFIFNRRGRLSWVGWMTTSPSVHVSVQADMDRQSQYEPLASRLEWRYSEQGATAKFDVERAALNAGIPEMKRYFQVPAEAVRLERMELNEER